jgi:hypothetical protein
MPENESPTTTHALALPRLESSQTIDVPSLSLLGTSEDGGVRSFRAARSVHTLL